MWIVRFILLGVLGVLVWLDSFLLRRRRQYSGLVENRIFNVGIVITHLAASYLVVILPPSGGWAARPAWMQHPNVCVAFATVGSALVCAGIVLKLLALKYRRAIGLQGSQAGLVTSGVYRYFRHPICTGVLWIALGLALLTRNPDGLLVFPAVFVAYLVQVSFEEKDDLGVRFGEQYRAYKRVTKMFGPVWLWSLLLAILLLIFGIARTVAIS
ncbi:MAG: isoprenylcysteine carboxylmethyltransferase family protein [Phycisphaerales bacterium]|nr:MAG: isoprenylcysteine carboxylmethyltransferase family protein [Phycisphaerales bacterium]